VKGDQQEPGQAKEPSYFRKVHHKGIHVQAVQETGKAFPESAQAFVHQLKMHQIGF
jgi:hypothetical protein